MKHNKLKALPILFVIASCHALGVFAEEIETKDQASQTTVLEQKTEVNQLAPASTDSTPLPSGSNSLGFDPGTQGVNSSVDPVQEMTDMGLQAPPVSTSSSDNDVVDP